MKKALVFFVTVLASLAFAQAQDSCGLRLSLLTCSPGSELYSTFGHTAIRVEVPGTGTDEVYNYGTFEFSPDFYVQFIRGKLLYALSVESFADFRAAYAYESRNVLAQELELSCPQKEQLYAALRNNALEQNRYYKYDFLLDNCTTRARDIVARNAGGAVQYKTIIGNDAPTFRELIHVYLNKGAQDWSKAGIDLLLGSRIDRQVTNREAMFLPDNLMKALDGASAGGQTLATAAQPVLTLPSPRPQSALLTPVRSFALLCGAILLLSFAGSGKMRRLTAVFDFILFAGTGLVGVLLLFMWLGTDHHWCANNYNLLWALPSNLVVAFALQKRGSKAALYLKALSLLMLVVALGWKAWPQQMNPAFLPFVLLLMVRAWMLQKRMTHDAGKNFNPQRRPFSLPGNR